MIVWVMKVFIATGSQRVSRKEATKMEKEILITMTADIVAAHVSNNSVAISDVGALVQRVHEALAGLDTPTEDIPQIKSPVVSIRASIKPDYLVCMECGKKQKTLKRHIQSAHQMTPDEYRRDYGLPREYPMVAASYSKQRSDMAHAIGLGQKGRTAKSKAAKGTKKPRGRKTETVEAGSTEE